MSAFRDLPNISKGSIKLEKKVKTEEEVLQDKVKHIEEGVDIWTAYYRANPHKFVKDFLNIELKPFQIILLYMMNFCTHFVFIACRGMKKCEHMAKNVNIR